MQKNIDHPSNQSTIWNRRDTPGLLRAMDHNSKTAQNGVFDRGLQNIKIHALYTYLTEQESLSSLRGQPETTESDGILSL
jgi:hypothetical protein